MIAHRSPDLAARLRTFCRPQNDVDLVHLDTIALAPYAAHCGGVPVVMTHHNIESQLLGRRSTVETGALARPYLRLQARRLAQYERRQATAFALNITVSEQDALTLQSLSPGCRTAVIPNGVDLDYFTPVHGVDQQALIYTGGMNMFANRDAVEWFLAEVWPRVKSEAPGTVFNAVGQDPSTALRRIAERDKTVVVPGFVDDVRPWVARSSVYVVPLRVGGGTRLKVLDAMAQGKAIVATRIGAEGICVDHDKHLLLADDPVEFAACVVALLRDPERRARLGRTARERAAELYSWPRLAKQLLDCYEGVRGDVRR